MKSSEDRLRAYYEDLQRVRAEAEKKGDAALADLRAKLDDVEARARAIEKEYDESRTVPEAGRQLSQRLNEVVEELGKRVDEAWERLKRH